MFWSPSRPGGHGLGWKAALVLGALVLAGCGRRQVYPVHGRIVDPDGKPITELKGATVEFENQEFHSSAMGTVEADGTFWLTTLKPKDGASVGKNQVCISRGYVSPEQRAPYVVLSKYDLFTTSGLEVTVEPKDNEVQLTLERVKPKR